jgi:hypothetical protein
MAPRARIITRFPESVATLIQYLEQCGYAVDTLELGQVDTSPADLEITVETYPREQALAKAHELASISDADVVVAPGVFSSQPAAATYEPPAEDISGEEISPEVLEELESSRESSFRAKGQTAGASLNGLLKPTRERVSAGLVASMALVHKAQKLASEWRHGASQQLRQWQERRQLAQQRAVERAASLRAAKLEQARLQAEERSRLQAQAEARRQELERERTLAQQRQQEQRAQEAAARGVLLRERQEREAARRQNEAREQLAREAAALAEQQREWQEREQQIHELRQRELEREEEDRVTPVASAPIGNATLLNRRPPRRSSSIVYSGNRNRDWKMAFIGAGAASALILIVSFGVTQRTPSTRPVQQKLPFGAATAAPNPPSLIIPAPQLTPSPTQPKVVVTRKSKPAASKPGPTTGSRTPQRASSRSSEKDNEDVADEVVVRHFPTRQAAKTQPDHNRVKRISDLE